MLDDGSLAPLEQPLAELAGKAIALARQRDRRVPRRAQHAPDRRAQPVRDPLVAHAEHEPDEDLVAQRSNP